MNYLVACVLYGHSRMERHPALPRLGSALPRRLNTEHREALLALLALMALLALLVVLALLAKLHVIL